MSLTMREPEREVALQVALAWHPRWWRLRPQFTRNPPSGYRGGWAFTWWFLHVQRWWRYV